MKTFIKSLLGIGALLALATGCTNGSSTSSSNGSTVTISGSLSVSSVMAQNVNLPEVKLALGLMATQRTQCSDGYYYDVYCVSFEDNPTSGKGDVDCNTGGAFAVQGMPAGVPIGCFVRRYTDATSTTGSTIGTIEVPAPSLSGTADSMVPESDISMTVSLSSSGGISATIDSGSIDTGSNTAGSSSYFDPTSFNGVYSFKCDSTAGGDLFAAGLCKCFFTYDFTGTTYTTQDDCINDPNGPGSQISGTPEQGVALYLQNATVQSNMNMGNGQSIPAGTTVQAISVWAATGSPGTYTSTRDTAGGEGATTMNGQLQWDNNNPSSTSITWSSSVNVPDPSNSSNTLTITLPTMPTDPNVSPPDINTARHGDWVTWIQQTVTNATSAGFACSDSSNTGQNPTPSVNCAQEILDSLKMAAQSSGDIVPDIYIRPYCDGNGCKDSDINTDLAYAHIEFKGGHRLDYPTTWDGTTDLSSTAPAADSIGVSPSNRYAFEPFIVQGNMGGFRQVFEDQRHFACDSTGSGPSDNSVCVTSNGYYDLVCHTAQELGIKFMPNSTSGYDVFFDQKQTVLWAELNVWSGGSMSPATPSGTTAFDMCVNTLGAGGGTFVAHAVKQ